MLVGILGDIEADCWLPETLEGVGRYQDALGRRFDLLLQVGDVSRGSWKPLLPTNDMAEAARRGDGPAGGPRPAAPFNDAELAEARQRHAARLPLPIAFVRGNHESLRGLQILAGEAPRVPAPIEPHGVLAWIPDGTVLDLGGVRVGFAGGALTPGDWGFDPACVDHLRAQTPIQVLVTHDGPLGLSVMPDGTPVGEPAIAQLLEENDGLALSVFGHRHHAMGPRLHRGPAVRGTAQTGPMLTMLPPARRPPEDRSLAVLDCDAGTFWVAGQEGNTVSAVRRFGAP